MKNHFKVSHIQYSLVFTITLFVVTNAINIDKLVKWFRAGDSYDYSAIIAYLVLGLSIFITVFLLFAHRWSIKWISVFFILCSAAVTYFISKYGVALDRTMLMNVVYTDPVEVKSLLSLGMVPYLLFLVFLPTILVIKTQISFHKTSKYLVQSAALAIVSLGMGVGLLYLEFTSIHRAGNISDKYILNGLVPVNYINAMASTLHKSTANYMKSREDIPEITGRLTAQKDIVVVLAIGESARQKNFSLYGYSQNQTNPLLAQIDGLHMLNGNAKIGTTLLALPEILQKDEVKLTSVTDKLGVKTDCLVHFKLYDNCEAVGEVSPASCGHDGRCYDEDVVPLLDKELESYQFGPRLIVLHLGGGSHGPVYKDRHPPEFRVFKPECLSADVVNQCTIDQIYNSYDNTILYTDYVLNRVLESLNNEDIPYVFIYVSDHGESLLEDGLIFHGMPPGIPLPPEQAEIPLLVHSSLPISIVKREKYSQNDIYDTVLALLSIETDGLNRENVFVKLRGSQE